MNNLKDLHKKSTLESFRNSVERKTYFESYIELYWAMFVLSFVCQIASFVSSLSYFELIVSFKLSSFELIFLFAVLIGLMIEYLKFKIVSTTFSKWFSKEREYNYPLLLASILICVASSYFSIVGGGILADNKAKPKSIESNYKNEISALQNDIKSVENSDNYKQVLWIGNGNTKTVITDEGKKLVLAKQKQIENLQHKESKALNKFETENASNVQNYQLWFASIEILFILFKLFCANFKRNVVLEEFDIQVGANNSEKMRTEIKPNETNVRSANLVRPMRINTIGFVPAALKQPEMKLSTPNENESKQTYFKTITHQTSNLSILEKYKCSIDRILELKNKNKSSGEIEKIILKEYSVKTDECPKIGRTTFYTIWKLLKELNFIVK